MLRLGQNYVGVTEWKYEFKNSRYPIIKSIQISLEVYKEGCHSIKSQSLQLYQRLNPCQSFKPMINLHARQNARIRAHVEEAGPQRGGGARACGRGGREGGARVREGRASRPQAAPPRSPRISREQRVVTRGRAGAPRAPAGGFESGPSAGNGGSGGRGERCGAGRRRARVRAPRNGGGRARRVPSTAASAWAAIPTCGSEAAPGEAGARVLGALTPRDFPPGLTPERTPSPGPRD